MPVAASAAASPVPSVLQKRAKQAAVVSFNLDFLCVCIILFCMLFGD
jgi:hypothetical protein